MVGKLRKKHISTQSELIELVNQEWKKIDKEQIDNWIDSTSGRIIEWIDHDGDRIKYSGAQKKDTVCKKKSQGGKKTFSY